FAVEQVLNQYPQFSPGETQFNASNVTPNSFATPGVSTLNMRGLGIGRSLVLVDGRRAQPVNAALSVDVNMIPAAMIESVEVITGGAAATYGSDALAGVVNFKLRTDFEGVRLNYQRGYNEAGDGAEQRADILLGGNFDNGRGNAVFNVAYAERDQALYTLRDFYMNGYLDPGTSSNYPRISYPSYNATNNVNPPSQAAIDSVFPQLPPGTIPPNTQFYLNPDGTVFTQANALQNGYTGPLTFPFKIREQTGRLEQIDPRRFMSSPMTKHTAFGRATYDIAENITVFAQGTFAESNVWLNGPATPRTINALPRDPSIESPAFQTLLDSRADPDAPYRVSEVANWMPRNRTSSNDTSLLDLTVGLQGVLPGGDWTWEAYTSYGQTTVLTNLIDFFWDDRYQEVATAPNFGQGHSFQAVGSNGVSQNVTLTCTSGLPIYETFFLDREGIAHYESDFQLTPDCVEAVTADMTMRNEVRQRIHETNFQGKVVDLPAGEMRAAIGASYREVLGEFHPDPLYNSATFTGGKTETSEVYGELLIPVVGRFELELGTRWSEFETSGRTSSANTYKTLFSWAPIESVRFRGGYQKAYRSPNVSELYSGPSRNPLIWAEGDPCRADTLNPWGNVAGNPNRSQVQELCRQLIYRAGLTPGANEFDSDPDNYPIGGAAVSTVFGVERAGNPDLEPEIADTYTLGMVWQSDAIDLSVSLDWYQIELAGAIDDLTFQTAYRQCFNFDGGTNPSYDPNNRFCRTINRDEDDGSAAAVRALFFNLGERLTNGVDLAVDWSRPLGGGDIGVRASINFLNTWKSSPVPGADPIEYRDTLAQDALYKYIPFTSMFYQRGPFRLGLNWRHYPEVRSDEAAENPNTVEVPTDSYNLFNLNGAWRFNDRFNLRGGIDNLFDEDPPVVGAVPGVNNCLRCTNSERYDVLGRRWYMAVEVTF
ncbi:MAG: TonB-dependent receptor, partial [Gemmatimonadota bacterium]|nr:TonB-dependent receptor [Gemmatimonadota bacterium]